MFDWSVIIILGGNGGNVSIHGDMASVFVVVPDKFDTRVARARPVLGDGVVFEEGIAQMVSMAVTNIFDAEIVKDEGEHDGAPLESPEARSGGDALRSKLFSSNLI